MRFLPFLLTVFILMYTFVPASAGAGVVPIVELNNNKEAYIQDIITIDAKVLSVVDEGTIIVTDGTGRITISEYKKDVLLGCEVDDEVFINLKYDIMHKAFRATFFTTYNDVGDVSIDDLLSDRSKYNGDIIGTKGILSEKKSATVYTFESTRPEIKSNLQSMLSPFEQESEAPVTINADWRPELPALEIGDTVQINGIYYIDPSNSGVNWIYTYSASKVGDAVSKVEDTVSKVEDTPQEPAEVPGFNGLLTAVVILLWSRIRS